jgi:tripartite-type tricarboxylate transporter receptor subunit TctC
VVDNRPGAGSIIGTDAAAKSAPDGYTLLMMSNTQTVNESLIPVRPFNLLKDFVPIAPINYSDLVLVAHPSVPAQNLPELIKYAKANPGKINFSSSGIGTSSHLGGELFKSMAGLDISHIAYKGTGPALQDLMSGQVQMTIDSLVTLLPFIKSGKLIALGVSSHERSPILPDVPPISDSLPGFESSTVNYMTVRTGTPRNIIDKLNRDMATVLRSAEVHDRFISMGILPVVETPEQLAGRIKRESEKWKRVIEVSGAKID